MPHKQKIERRAFTIERDSAIDEAERTVELAFSSEEPYERHFGTEILDHSPESIQLGRMTDGAPVLVDHDPTDHVGVVESVSVDGDRRGRAIVRFGRGARATEIFNDVVDGIRRSISVGYKVLDMIMEREATDGKPPVYRVNKWEPL
ncbi:MAG: phage major capsid protein, partial [Proteobacteria bacterium]|nr:phage major capsid protein [Pseudomonadota bacterium]